VIPCFKCKVRSGIECGGRKPGESTLCVQCMEERLTEDAKSQAKHLASYLDGVRDTAGERKVRYVWDMLSQEEQDELRKIIGDSGVSRILSVETEERTRVGGQWKGRVHEIAERDKTSARVEALQEVIGEIQDQNTDLDDSEAAEIADTAMSWVRSRDGEQG